MRFDGKFDPYYNNKRNRNYNQQNRNRRNNNRVEDAKRAINGSMLPSWYRNRFFNDCAEDVQERTIGGEHALEYAYIGRKGDDRNKRDDRRFDPRREPKEQIHRRFEKPAPQEKKAPDKHQEEKDILDRFIFEYGNHISDISYLTKLLTDMFPDVLGVLRKYGDNRYVDLNGSMDKVFSLMCTSQMSNLILAILQDNGFDNWDTSWKDLAVVISIVLSNYGNRINNTGAKSCYVNDIIPSGAMWKREIDILTEDYNITREMAMDLVMKIPVMAEDMKLWDLNQYFIGFEWCIMTHGKDNMEVLDDELQGKLFDFFFKAPENDMTAKALSRFLAAPPVPFDDEDTVLVAINDAFRAMIYAKLDKLDIEEIERTLRYIARERKQYEKEGKSIELSLYTGIEAVQFENISKALQNVVETDNSAKQYLA